MDNACAFKPLDFMSALSIALTTDDDRMFTLFARETAKFALSHSDTEKYLWPYHQTVGLANGKDRLQGCPEVSGEEQGKAAGPRPGL